MPIPDLDLRRVMGHWPWSGQRREPSRAPEIRGCRRLSRLCQYIVVWSGHPRHRRTEICPGAELRRIVHW